MQSINDRAAGFIAERLQIAAREACTWVRRVDRLSADLRHTHTVSGSGHRQFGIHRIAFTIGVFFIQQRRGDSIRKTINRPVQRVIFDFEIKGRAVRCRAGIVAAAMHF